WRLPTISAVSRDRLPNPIHDRDDHRYVPVNRPAIGDLMNLFVFADEDGDHHHHGHWHHHDRDDRDDRDDDR
ncbi:MAG: phosphoesterase, partial [Bradyrhizobium sp.]|nr:phosphoesterase [Bradyrhizobium sp.]